MRRATGAVPPRQTPVLRAPAKSGQHSDAYKKMFGAQDEDTARVEGPPYDDVPARTPPTVYVAHHPACAYSEDLVALAEECNVEVEVYDIEEVDPPEWLLGTPTLHAPDGSVYCGDAAFAWIVRNRGEAPRLRATTTARAPVDNAEAAAYGFLAPPPVDAPPIPGAARAGLDIGTAYARGGQDDLEAINNRAQGEAPRDVDKLMNSIMQDRG